MARKATTIDSLTRLFDESSRPIYAVDSDRRVVYCNRALAIWLDMEPGQIIGRKVEYHSEPASEDSKIRQAAPLADLCPPPQAFSGEPTTGTLSCMARGGGLVHRQAEFVPLAALRGTKATRDPADPARCAVLVFLASADVLKQALASELSADPTADELHRAIRRFRRAQASRYSIHSLLGSSQAMQKVRVQVAAAAASGANTLIYGRPGSGRGHVARAIHYNAASSGEAKLVPIDCALLTDEQLRRALDSLRGDRYNPSQRPTLLLENLERMSPAHQSVVLNAIRQNVLSARIIATCNEEAPTVTLETEPSDSDNRRAVEVADNARILAGLIDPALLSAISTITIDIPPLVERLEDLPVLAQYSLETCNKGSDKQVGGVRSDALDLLALYSWPGEFAQLRDVIRAAHGACAAHEIVPADLPAVVHHAASAAERMRRPPERIVLDDLLATIEKEAIVRALAQAGGNKSEAAELLGMTRPRLYRRLVQLGLAGMDGEERQPEQPEFVERDPAE